MKRIPALDALRGIAIIMVLIHHYLPSDEIPSWAASLIKTFWSGVDLFFVLSGFLIATILLTNAKSDNYFSVFYIRRSTRILPLYWLLFFVVEVLVHFQPTFFDAKLTYHLPFWSYAIFAQNFLYAGRGFWKDPWLDTTWSLALEEQFYIFLSIAVRWTSKKVLMLTCIILIIVAPMLGQQAPSRMHVYQLPIYRAASLMFGVLVAVLWQSQQVKDFICKNRIYFWLITILIAVNFRHFTNITVGDPIGHLELALVYTCLLLLALAVPLERSGFIFGSKTLEWFGVRSYGLYLIHKPVQILCASLLTAWSIKLDFIYLLILTVFILFVIAELSYHFLEQHFIDFGHRFKYSKPELCQPSTRGIS